MSKRKESTTHKRSDSRTTASGKPKVEWKGYVNWELTESHKKAFSAWIESKPAVDDLIHRVCQDGYDLKVRYDQRNDCYSGQLYCQDEKNGNAGWCLSMRAADYWKAILRVLFVHFIALEEVWSEQGIDGWTDDKW